MPVLCEIEDHFVIYFDRIAVFEVPYRCTLTKGGAHTCFLNLAHICASTKNDNVSEIRDRIIPVLSFYYVGVPT